MSMETNESLQKFLWSQIWHANLKIGKHISYKRGIYFLLSMPRDENYVKKSSQEKCKKKNLFKYFLKILISCNLCNKKFSYSSTHFNTLLVEDLNIVRYERKSLKSFAIWPCNQKIK